ncbi:MAG TPA: FAD-binding oxidoreductase, partial [Myxococcaceae bacterium]|nr:FAD-binding oxidoreductase [Myxococcaceae bacterium]
RRRRFLELLAGSAGLGLLRPLTSAGAGPTVARRVQPVDPGWPGEAAWNALGKQLRGSLTRVESPLAGPASPELLKQLENPYFIGDQAWATQSSGWAGAWSSKPSAYAVSARTAEDVAAAVSFARKNRIRLVVKGGGHSYQGTSNAADSLLVWTRPMDKIVLHDAFTPQGCQGKAEAVPAVSVGAGQMWMHTYDAVTTRGGRYVQGGGCATVGVAGLIQSGGFGSFSKRYGMAAASLLEADVVTADGKIRTVNACTEPELFWAIKGGGGGTFGVVTRLTLKTHTLPETFGVVFASIQAESDEAYRRLIERFVSFYRTSLFNPSWGEQARFNRRNRLDLTMLFQGLDKTKAEEIWRPFFAEVERPGSGLRFEGDHRVVSFPARAFWNPDFLKSKMAAHVRSDPRSGAPANNIWWASNVEELGAYWHGYQSTWMPEALLRDDRQKDLAAAIYAASRHWTVGFHFNKGLAGSPPEAIAAARDTATNPAVLGAFALVIIAGSGAPVYPGVPGHAPDESEAKEEARQIGLAMAEIRKLVPDPGSYVSESNYFEKDWRRAFWGSNYARLRQIKKKYDPDGLFFVHHGVGSEDWSADGMARLGS